MDNPFEKIENRLETIEAKIDSLMQEILSPATPKVTWMTSKQAAQYLGVSSAFMTSVRGSKIPYYKLGSKVLFKKQEIDGFIEKTRHKTGGEYLDEYLVRR